MEEKLSMTFRKMEQKRGFGVTLEHVKEWIEDCEIVIGSEMKSYVRKERENGLMEEENNNNNTIIIIIIIIKNRTKRVGDAEEENEFKFR